MEKLFLQIKILVDEGDKIVNYLCLIKMIKYLKPLFRTTTNYQKLFSV